MQSVEVRNKFFGYASCVTTDSRLIKCNIAIEPLRHGSPRWFAVRLLCIGRRRELGIKRDCSSDFSRCRLRCCGSGWRVFSVKLCSCRLWLYEKSSICVRACNVTSDLNPSVAALVGVERLCIGEGV